MDSRKSADQPLWAPKTPRREMHMPELKNAIEA